MPLKPCAPFLCLVLASTYFIGGCATMKYGTTQVVTVESNPKGAKVKFQPGGQEIITPSQVVLSRRSSYVAYVEKEGFEPESVTLTSSTSDSIWRNLIWIHPLGWIIGIVVDISTGAGKDLTPEKIDVTLTPFAVVDKKSEEDLIEENGHNK